ncbi:EcsC family protein [Cellulosimicrobium cellulans]|uniref:EcsC family protein n=1 Tax=Cellulosimicrobium cellulans TaxID=1710 RepID=UPI0030173889
MTATQDETEVNAVARALLKGLDKAVQIGRPAILAHVRATVRRDPQASPEKVVKLLGRQFTGAVAASGGAAGGIAAAPAVGLPAGLALGVADAGVFTTAAATYVLAVAEVYGIPTEDVVRRRTLLLGILLGDSATPVIREAAGRTGAHWGRRVVQSVPVSALRKVNGVLGKNFVTKYGTKQGILVLGKAVPFGIGAAIGAGGNAAFAQFTIRSTRKSFGPPPDEIPQDLRAEGDPSAPAPVDLGTIDAEIVED